MPALPTDEAKEFYRLTSQMTDGLARTLRRIAPRTSISQLSPAERADLRQWMQEQINGTGDGQQPA